MSKISDNDPDRAKGATEEEQHHHDGNTGLEEQTRASRSGSDPERC